ncbi:cytochrome P450 [Polaromonas sp.]|uniref:cytochrome P450 n=1 Tax=Polaromonas sp. TaxID=1869339 RepID=UPI00286B99D3|nr:cytochrome P450 [Polaromonas sp.]
MRPDHILAAAAHPDPYPFYATLRAGPPLVYDAPHKLWIASSAACVKQVLQNPACQVRPAAEPVPLAILGSAAGDVFGHLVRMNEGARHDAPKLALQRFLASVDLDRLRQRTQTLAATVLENALESGAVSGAGLTRWASAVPVMAVADLLGFEQAELGQVALWMDDFVACLSPLSSEARLAAAAEAARALLLRFSALVRSAPATGGSAIARLQAEAARVGWNNADALLANLVGLLSQTCEATAGLLGNSIVALATQPGLLDTVTRQPGQLPAMVQEVSRHDPSIHNTRRFVAQATQIAGTPVPAGAVILLLLAAASRDPAANPQPDDFLLDRAERQTPGFGHGPHQCPGQALACTVAAAALQALLDSGRLQPAMPRHWQYRPSANARIPVFAD